MEPTYTVVTLEREANDWKALNGLQELDWQTAHDEMTYSYGHGENVIAVGIMDQDGVIDSSDFFGGEESDEAKWKAHI